MLNYNANLKDKACQLRKNSTDSENALWSRLRNNQLLGIQFYRQKPIGEHIVDFFAPRVKLVVEVDGSQHLVGDPVQKDRIRDAYLASLGLKVLRFHSREVLKESDAVVEAIYRMITEQLSAEIPPIPPLKRGELKGKTSKLALMPLEGEGRVGGKIK
jgi:very-short-patch-repair endonuclease